MQEVLVGVQDQLVLEHSKTVFETFELRDVLQDRRVVQHDRLFVTRLQLVRNVVDHLVSIGVQLDHRIGVGQLLRSELLGVGILATQMVVIDKVLVDSEVVLARDGHKKNTPGDRVDDLYQRTVFVIGKIFQDGEIVRLEQLIEFLEISHPFFSNQCGRRLTGRGVYREDVTLLQLVLVGGAVERILIAKVDPGDNQRITQNIEHHTANSVVSVENQRRPKSPKHSDDNVIAQGNDGVVERLLILAEILDRKFTRHLDGSDRKLKTREKDSFSQNVGHAIFVIGGSV